MKLLLLWVAASDGDVDESELEFALSNFPDAEKALSTADLLEAIRQPDLRTIEMAIRTVSAQSRELRAAFLDMAISMSMADREIAISENHILRFYADALYLGIAMLEKRFKAISGETYFPPGDPGNLDWWKQQGSKVPQPRDPVDSPDDKDREDSDQLASSPTQMTSWQARTILGVSAYATPEEIDQAHEDLVGIFQVERMEEMSEAAISAANIRLKKIEDAYKLLRN